MPTSIKKHAFLAVTFSLLLSTLVVVVIALWPSSDSPLNTRENTTVDEAVFYDDGKISSTTINSRTAVTREELNLLASHVLELEELAFQNNDEQESSGNTVETEKLLLSAEGIQTIESKYQEARMKQLAEILVNEQHSYSATLTAKQTLEENLANAKISNVSISNIDCRESLCQANLDCPDEKTLDTMIQEIPFAMPWKRGGFVTVEKLTIQVYFAQEGHSLPTADSIGN
jgi:hypothetical protein